MCSRAAVQAAASTSGKPVKKKKLPPNLLDEDQPFSGAILLKFKHSPKLAESDSGKGWSTGQAQIELICNILYMFGIAVDDADPSITTPFEEM